MSTHTLCFEQKYEKYQNLYLKTFSFWWLNCHYIYTDLELLCLNKVMFNFLKMYISWVTGLMNFKLV